MLKRYFKNSLRSFLRYKVHSTINLLGLIVGVFSALVIILYANYELGYDAHNKNKYRIFRLTTSYHTNSGVDIKTALTSSGLAPVLRDEFPEVETTVRLVPYNGTVEVQYKSGDNKVFKEKYIYRTEAELLKVFTHQVLQGSPDKALSEPNSVVLSEKLAKKYFGAVNPINKALRIDNVLYKVTGIIKNMPHNSDLYAEAFISYNYALSETWNDFDVYTYALMTDGAKLGDFTSKINETVEKNTTALDQYNMNSDIKVELQPLTKVHFIQGLADDTPKGNKNYILILLLIGTLIIGLVAINYINMSIIQSVERTVQIGIRKILGASKTQLVTQFVGETLLLTIGAFLISLILLAILVPHINAHFNINLSFLSLFEDRVLVSIFLMIICIGSVSAIYPAVFLSSMNITQGLKGKRNLPGSQMIRRILLIMQFGISYIAIVCTFIINDQMDYLWNKDLGFSKGQTMIVDVPTLTISDQKLYQLRNDLMQYSSITSASIIGSDSYPGAEKTPWQLSWTFNGKEKVEYGMNIFYVDENFTQLLDIPLLSGRSFQPEENQADIYHAILVNKAFVSLMKWTPEQALGQQVIAFENKWSVIGVIEDFYYQSLNNKIKPLFIAMANSRWPQEKKMLVKITDSKDIDLTSSKWQAYTSTPIAFNFLDEAFDRNYKNEQALTQAASYFSIITIFMACIGLFGLSSLLSLQRTKEIGIRKILGGSTMGIVLLLLKYFLFLAAIGCLIGIPIALYVAKKWLADFPYQVSISALPFLNTSIILFLVIVLTTSYHIIKSALIRPAELLRYE